MYLPELIAKNGEAQVRAVLESHFVSPAAFDILLRVPFTAADYDAFLTERYHSILQAIENLLIKERLDLPSHLRLLDAEVEQVELSLRALIAEVLKEDIGAVPADLKSKVDGRIASAARSATFESQRYSQLSGWLEFADLRELQAIILNGNLWARFAQRFGTKPELDAKFGQLANVRNAIRHSRHVDKVREMEGRASVLWFQSLLSASATAAN
jgi:hypothetical protein